ncbi:hypothetical protein CXF85_21180 [Colwellia sp. 75C3]|uniref:hypothetical protein n=1 Tax=Colwellia sp. 75C3 TaxID=888425 RepID=UPI000C324212|nr:hypothetical protein [Colwellia sp. 75C3]PKG80639.1 hypothetical protein CXF85_21180 [Colwellia sp. 75C3]
MKFYPYSIIESKNLKALLISARVLGFFSYLLFFAALFIGILGVVNDVPKTGELSSGLKATLSAPGTTGPAILFLFWGVISSIGLLAFSGLCAAVVSCEHKFTSTSE